MKIHSGFTVRSPRYAWLAELLNSDTALDGGFARVVPYSSTSVIKATCCSATNLLFDELWQQSVKGISTPHNLPAILKRYSAHVQDHEKVAFQVWEVERLFAPGDTRGQLVARATGRRTLAHKKPGYLLQHSKDHTLTVSALQEVLQVEQSLVATTEDWRASAHVAMTMAMQSTGSLRDTFQFLQDFVTRHQVRLDLLGRGNILVNMFGEPCLSDAVCDIVDCGEPVFQAEKGRVLACGVPISVNGTTVRLQPRATFPLTAEEQSRTQQHWEQLGLKVQVFDWGSAALQAFLAQPIQERPIWEHPKAARQLRQDAYSQAFAG